MSVAFARGGVRGDVSSFAAIRGPLAALFVALVVTASAGPALAKADPDACPIGTQVAPFAPSSAARYTVTVRDGGEGDLDGVRNGRCDVDVALCVPTDGCEAVTVHTLRGRARGALQADDRVRLDDAFAALASAVQGAVADASRSGELCRTERISAPAVARGGKAVTLRATAAAVDASGVRRVRRSRVTVRCLSEGKEGAECAARRGRCPSIVPRTCGDGVRQSGEVCDGADAGACGGACRTDCTCPVAGVSSDVAPQARIVGSSDRRHGRADAVVDGHLGASHEWQSDGESGGAFLRLTWRDPVRIDRVVLFDAASLVDNVTDASIIFDDGSSVPAGALPADGAAHAVSFPARTVLALTVALSAVQGVAGLGEVQVLASSGPDEPPPPTPGDPPPPAGPAYYIAPNGDDGAAGTSPTTAWRTFGRALRALAPGDTLVLADGTYTRGTTGLPRIDCRTNGTARSGRADAPITIRAANERRAFLQSDGTQTAFEMLGCAWWNVEGLRTANRDAAGDQMAGYPVRLDRVDHVNVRRMLASHNNRRQNTHVYAVENSTHVVLEDCEAYYFHRHGFSVWRSRHVTLRRCYANSMRWGERGCCSAIDNRAYGDEAISLYGTSDSVIENAVSENQANGIQIHGIANPLDPSGSGGRNNRVLGSVSLDDSVGLLISSRVVSGRYHNARNNLVRDFVALRPTGHGVYVRGAAGARVENSTILAGRAAGIMADTGDTGFGGTCGGSNPDGCSIVVRNALAVGNAGTGLAPGGMPDWRIEWSMAGGNGRDFGAGEALDDAGGRVLHSRLGAPADAGTGAGQCALWPKAGSVRATAGANGGMVGADLSRRYEGGHRTETPLWDPTTGAFPCGAVVAGVNDGPVACRNVHTRVNVAGCR